MSMHKNMSCNYRKQILYTEQEMSSIRDDIHSILYKISSNHKKGISPIHENQDEFGKKISNILTVQRDIVNILVYALTQSGKTGAMIAIIKHYIEANFIPTENIFIITGASSTDWAEQTKERMPNEIANNVFHRNHLNQPKVGDKIKKILTGNGNILLFIDEMQIAAQEDQTLYNFFENCGLYSLDNILNRDIKIIEFSATPNGGIYDIMNWKNHGKKLKLMPGTNYKSCFDLYDTGRVFHYQDIFKNPEDILPEIGQTIKEKYKEDFRYHIFRVPIGKKGLDTKSIFEKYTGIKVIKEYDEKDEQDINDILSKKPDRHCVIFVKEKLRFGKTLTKKYIGILYERYTKKCDDSVIIQGLIGRGTGYDDNGVSLYYTNTETIKKYKNIWDSDFENKEIEWKSNTTYFKKGKVRSKQTYKSGSYYQGLDFKEEKDDSKIEPFLSEYNNFSEVKDYIKKEYNKNIKKEFLLDKNGFEMNNLRGETKVMDYHFVIKNSGWGLGEKFLYRIHVCYEDIEDKNSKLYIIAEFIKK
jgi:hypothetical protein